jgi:hypothetical protein
MKRDDIRSQWEQQSIFVALKRYPGLEFPMIEKEDASKLSEWIESIFVRVPTQKMFVEHNYDRNRFTFIVRNPVFDAAVHFVNNTFPLTDMKFFPDEDGKYFEDLPPVLQRRITENYFEFILVSSETTPYYLDLFGVKPQE